MPNVIEINAFTSFTLAILILFVGKWLSMQVKWLQKYSIPEPVIGGLCCTLIVCAAYYLFDIHISFELEARNMLLLYFFAAIGLNSEIQTLKQGGRALIYLTIVATVFMLLQNMLGMGIASAFDLDSRLGLMVGSISLTGGVGTTMAWASHFTDTLGLHSAVELGIAANMFGLISACIIGGPIAGFLIRKHGIKPSADTQLEIGTLLKEEPFKQLNYYGVLMAIFWLNIALMLGRIITRLIAFTGLNLPAFVGCLLAGIAIRSLGSLVTSRKGRLWRWKTIWRWNSMQPGIALISDISLGMFLTMALMGLQLWLLQPILAFITTAMILQILLVIVFTVFIVFRVMGRDYEAAVMCSGFGGIALGSTATAIANMSAVTRQYGNAPRAFIVVPLVCGFFIDLINAFIIGFMAV